jgi:hypothetical protein
LGEQLGQHGRIAHIAAGELDSPDFQGSLINSEVSLAPYTAFGDDVNSATCPLIRPICNDIMSQLDQEIGRIGDSDVRLLSIAIDPSCDTPGLMAEAAQNFDASDRGFWLTGWPGGIRRLPQTVRTPVRDLGLHDLIFLSATGNAACFIAPKRCRMLTN